MSEQPKNPLEGLSSADVYDLACILEIGLDSRTATDYFPHFNRDIVSAFRRYARFLHEQEKEKKKNE